MEGISRFLGILFGRLVLEFIGQHVRAFFLNLLGSKQEDSKRIRNKKSEYAHVIDVESFKNRLVGGLTFITATIVALLLTCKL